VQGHLEKVLTSLFREEVTLHGTSRTDAGVHALGQRASFQTDITIPIEKVPLVVNNALAGAEKGSFAISPIRIMAAEEKDEEFHARFDSKGKTYIYKIRNTDNIDLFQRNYCYHVRDKLDVTRMREAALTLQGTHDFKGFEASGGNPRQTTVRTIHSLDVLQEPDGIGITLRVTGDGFLYNMVRIITGTLVDIGAGRLDVDSVSRALEMRDRREAGHTAPPYGLYLAEIYY
jgi:tRNA pseudouridine38-40 synthase